MPKDMVVIGASAGGIEALRVLVGRLPADLPASLFIVLHTSPEAPSMLADILGPGSRSRPSPLYAAQCGDSRES
jgi:two-component system, chemotaxis family, protein-glutamate methylesterase/glutaminase